MVFKMKLKTIVTNLRTDTNHHHSSPINEITLVSCSDADRYMNDFIQILQHEHSTIPKTMIIRTDFLMDLQEENVVQFLSSLGTFNLQQLTIQSSSRFHMDVIPANGLLSLRSQAHPGLVRLVLEDMQVTASHKEFITSLGTAVEGHGSLQEMILINFFANDWANTEPYVLDPLFAKVSTIPHLKKLELSGCGSHALSGQDVPLVSTMALQELMVQTRTNGLTFLQLSFLELEDDHFEVIAMQLTQHNTCLTHLSLDYHKLNSRGFQEMMSAMEQNSTLKSLSLRSLRDIGEEGFAQAMTMLQKNYSIESLSVTASPSQQAEIDLYLRMNGAGRGLLREPTASMGQWVDVLARNSEDIDVVRHLLQEIPSLCSAAAQASETTVPA